jgi:hypothetical protein
MLVQVIPQIIGGELKLIPDINWVLSEAKELLNAELYVLKRKVGSLGFEVVHKPGPKMLQGH